jgi:hypothetical protein
MATSHTAIDLVEDTEFCRGYNEKGEFDRNKYVVEKMKTMTCDSHTPPCQLVNWLLKRADEYEEKHYMRVSK